MQHRIFIAINLPQGIKEELLKFQKKHKDLDVHWTKPENLHITLDFIGNLNDQKLKILCDVVKKRVGERRKFKVKLNRIVTASGRMIWATGNGYHITLARTRNRGLAGKRINEPIDLEFEARSIDIMESELKPEGPKYTKVCQIKLKPE